MELFGLLLCFCSGTYGVYITHVESGTDIPTSCNLVAPSLSIHGAVVNTSLDAAFASQGSTPSGVWVDYISDYVYLQVIGCIYTSDVYRAATILRVSMPIRDPFYCVTVCDGTEFIGLTITDGVTTCMCLTSSLTSINTTRSTCSITCGGNELMCGSQGSAAVYKQVSELNLISKLASFQDTSQEGHCLSNKSGTPEWRKCNATVYAACMSNPTDGTYETFHTYRFWLDAMALCFKYQRTAVQFGNSVPSNNVKEPGWWIGLIRGKTTLTAQARTNADVATLPTRQYGFLRKDGTIFYLQFTSNTTLVQWALCNGSILDTNRSTGSSEGLLPDPTRSSSKENMTTIHSGIGIILESTQISANLLTSTVNTAGEGLLPDPTPSSSKENMTTIHSVGLYVGISIAVVVLIVTVTGGVCFWRRRKGHPMKDNRDGNQFPSGSTAMTNKAYICEDETLAYIKDGKGRAKIQDNPSDIADTTNDPHYFVLERKRNSDSSSNRNSTVKSNDNGHYNCIEDPEPYSGAIENEIEDATDNYHTIPHSESKSQPRSLSDNYDRITPTLGCDISNSNDTGMSRHAPKGNNSGNPKPVTGQRDDYDRLCLKGAPNTINNYDKLGMNRNAIDTSTYSRIDDKTTVHSDYDRINQVMSSGKDDTYDHIRRQNVAFNEDNNHTDHDNGGTGYDTVSNVPKTYHNEDCGHYSHVPSG